MKRRTFILRTTAIGTVALAGCTGSSSQAAETIESARETLLENEETFENFSNQFESGETPNFDAEQVRTRVERANETLDEAEQNASDEQREYIDALRAWGEFQIKRAETIAISIRLTSKWDTISAYLDSGQYEQAKSALSEAESIYSDLQTASDDMKSAYREVNQDALEDGGLTAYDDEITNWFSNIDSWLKILGVYLDGIGPLLDGMINYNEGIEAYQDERFGQAATTFENAQTDFAVAERELERLEQFNTDFPTLEADNVRVICAAGALKESAGLMDDSANAAEQGDYRKAEDYANQAKEAANKCNLNSG